MQFFTVKYNSHFICNQTKLLSDFCFIILRVKLAFFQLSKVESKGRFAVELVKFDNSGGLKADGTCCDGVNIAGCPIPTQKCDYHFQLCASEPSSK